MSSTCQFCGENTLEHGSHHIQEYLVCTSCGAVAEDSTFADNSSHKGTSYVANDGTVRLNMGNVPQTIKRLNCTSIPVGKSEGLTKIKHLSSLYHLSSEMQNDANKLFCFAFSKEFLNEAIKSKLILAGCCVYVVLRQHNFPVISYDICNHLQCKIPHFYSIFKRLKTVASIELSMQSVEELVPVVLKDAIFGDEKQKVLKKTSEVIVLANSCWLTTGRSPNTTIIAAAFIAWKSLDPTRWKTTFQQFCSKFSLQKATAVIKAKEMATALVKLAEQIPWIEKGTVKESNISAYLDDVLKFSNALRMTASSSDKDSSSNDLDVEEYNKFRTPQKKRKYFDSDCPAKQLKVNYELENSANDDSISDSEIEKCIRSEDEVNAIINYQKSLNSNLAVQE